MTYQKTLTALADPTRRKILEAVLAAPSSVGALAETSPVSRPAVSQHLRVLKDANLVNDTRQGARRIYSVDTAGLAELRAWLESFWSDALTSSKQFTESDEGGSDGTTRS